MALTLSAIITAARDRHPAFHRSRVTDAVLARYLSDYQNALIAKAAIRDRSFLAQTAAVSLALSGSNAPGTAGAGTSGGVPGRTTDDVFATTEASTGSVIEVGLTPADGAAVVVSESVVTSATRTTLTKTGASRTTDQDVGRVLVITAGTGLGQRRAIVSNTADTWSISNGSDGITWTTTPDATSLFLVVDPVFTSDDTAGAVTALPSTTTNYGYLVKLDAGGTPYIDYTEPLTAKVEQGVPLPSLHALIPDLCQWWPVGGTAPERLTVVTPDRRFAPGRMPAVYTVGQTLYLCGETQDWTAVGSLELRYVPVAPTFTALTDVFLLPDLARPALIAAAAAFMAERVAGMADVTIDPTLPLARAERDERDFLRTVTLAKRGRTARIAERW